MIEVEWIKLLERPAVGVPTVDVVDSVMADIRRRAGERPDVVLRITAGVSGLAAAAVVAVASAELYSVIADPALAIVGSFAGMVMQ